MTDIEILKRILKDAILSYKDVVSNVHLSTFLSNIDETSYAKCIKKIYDLEEYTKNVFNEMCPKLSLSTYFDMYTLKSVDADGLIKEPYDLDKAFEETKSGPSSFTLEDKMMKKLEEGARVVIDDSDIANLPEGATREDVEEDTISLFDFLLETLKALPEEEHAWIEGFLEDKSKYKAGNFVDAIKDTLIYDIVSRLKDGELVPIPYKVYPEIEEEVAKQFKNYMISYENGLCRLSILDDLKVK